MTSEQNARSATTASPTAGRKWLRRMGIGAGVPLFLYLQQVPPMPEGSR